MEALKNYTITMKKGTSQPARTIISLGARTQADARSAFRSTMQDYISDYDHSEYICDDSPALPDYYRGAGWYHEDGAQIMLDGDEYTAVEFGDARYELVEKTIYDIMNEFPRDAYNESRANISFHDLIIEAIENEHACLIWLADSRNQYDWMTYDTDDEAISAALGKGLPCLIIPADPKAYIDFFSHNDDDTFSLAMDEDYDRGLAGEKFDSIHALVEAFMDGDKDWDWKNEINNIGSFWTRHRDTTHMFKLTEASSCPDEPGVIFSGNPLRKDWEYDAQAAADLLADFIAQSSIYDATERPDLAVIGMGIYDGDDLNCHIQEIDWSDISTYARRFNCNFTLRLEASEMAALGFAEFESGEWDDPVIIHFAAGQTWAETASGNMCYEAIDDEAFLIDELKRRYPIYTMWDDLRLV